MSDKKTNLRKKCTILMVINIFLTFYAFGMPKQYENKHHFYEDDLMPVTHMRKIRLNADVHVKNEDGEEIVIEAGAEHEIMIAEEWALIFVSDEDETVTAYTVSCTDLDYEDITEDNYEEAIKHNEQVKAEAPCKYILYRLANIFWFVVPSQMWLFYYPCGIVGGLIAFAFEKLRFRRFSKKEAYKTFIAIDAVIAAVIATLTVLYMLNPITCR